MAKTTREWLDKSVVPVKGRSMRWLSEHNFFRDPVRPIFNDPNYFFSPADGRIIYQTIVDPQEAIVDLKGVPYSLRDALRDPGFGARSLVIGIFMTFYDVHVNRIPYSGVLSRRELPPLRTHNRPMLGVERAIIDEHPEPNIDFDYMASNQRVVNRVHAWGLRQDYYILQIADYEVDCITPFQIRQNVPVAQNRRFSQIRFGSQVDLIIPLSNRYTFEFTQELNTHVEAGQDPLVRIGKKHC